MATNQIQNENRCEIEINPRLSLLNNEIEIKIDLEQLNANPDIKHFELKAKVNFIIFTFC